MKSKTPITDEIVATFTVEDDATIPVEVARQLERSAIELALYLAEYTKQADESHEPLYWLACRALERFRKLKEQTVAAMPNDRS